MASLPQHAATNGLRSSTSSRESGGPTSDSAEPLQPRLDPCDMPSGSIEDRETVLLNTSTPRASETTTSPKESSKKATPTMQGTTAADEGTNTEPRKCWICYADETEDTPLNSEWRSPCPCALTAHEACLLDWLADLENPKSRKRNGRPAKMLCPQCKSEIVISRPRSVIVDLVRSVERIAGRLVLPGMVFTLAGTVWAGCCAHGVYSMYLVFGTDDARRIFDGGATRAWNPRLNLGLPLIPLVLIFSRTRYAEGLLPAIPVLFFATHQPGGQELEVDMWPPSAAMTFAALPYAKSFYSVIYERLFGRLERKWISEVQPRSGGDDNNGEQGHNDGGDHPDGPGVGNGEFLMEIDLEFQVGIGDGGDQEGVAELRAGGDREPAEVNGAGGEGQAAQNPAEVQENQILGRRQGDLIHETSNIADTVLGALLFPAISASMGGFLKMALPKTWTTPPSTLEKGKAGLLQSRWGRSVVGGCLFVLLKDALVLYCRWKLAQTHRKRRVLNYDRTQKQVVGRRG